MDALWLLTHVRFKNDLTPLNERYWLLGRRLFGLLFVRSSIDGPNAAPTCANYYCHKLYGMKHYVPNLIIE